MKGLGITAVMVMTECFDVVLYTLTKAATNTGMSDFVYVFYSNALGFFFLLTCSFFYYRKRTYPPLTYRIIGKLFLVGLLSCTSQILKYVAIDLSSPTLATAISNLTPAFAFIIAIISRMEVLDMRIKSSRAKSIGTVISVAGALIVTLYKGVPLTSAPLPSKFLNQLLFSIESKWFVGGFMLLLQSFSLALTFVVQAWVMREYSAELMATLFCCISVTIISAPVALIAERSNPDAWQIKSNMEFIAIGFNAVFAVAFRKAVHLWAVREKGPIYLAMFKPIRIVIAFIFGIIFLGETVYLGRVIGGAIVTGGFYAMIWGKAQEEKVVEYSQTDPTDNSSSHTLPFLQNQITAK